MPMKKLAVFVIMKGLRGIKKVKDIAAGAVLVAAFFSAITGAIIFLSKIINLIKSI